MHCSCPQHNPVQTDVLEDFLNTVRVEIIAMVTGCIQIDDDSLQIRCGVNGLNKIGNRCVSCYRGKKRKYHDKSDFVKS